MGKLRLRCAVQISDYRHCILRVCSKRPRRCATDKGYEVAPFHYRPLARGQCSVAIKPILLKRECPLWVTCGRRLGKNFLTLLQHWSGAVTCPACLCGGFGRWP